MQLNPKLKQIQYSEVTASWVSWSEDLSSYSKDQTNHYIISLSFKGKRRKWICLVNIKGLSFIYTYKQDP